MTQEVKLHENNKRFEWSMPAGPFEFLNPEQIKSFDKIPRNSKCPCGSGKKFKHCCGKL